MGRDYGADSIGSQYLKQKGESMNTTVGIKYCGGCNPNYDRKGVADIIEKLPGIETMLYSENAIPDITLVICGCSSDCINADKYKSKYGTIMINDPRQTDEAIKYIKSVKQNNKI